MAGPPRNASYRTKLYNESGVAVTATPVTLVDNYLIANFSRITGTARSDQGVTLSIFQGAAVDAYDYQTDITVPADTDEGDGAGWSVEVLGEYCKIVAVRSGGSDNTAFRAGIYGRATS